MGAHANGHGGAAPVHDWEAHEIYGSAVVLASLPLVWGILYFAFGRSLPTWPFGTTHLGLALLAAAGLVYFLRTWDRPNLPLALGFSVFCIVSSLILMSCVGWAWCARGRPLEAFPPQNVGMVSLALVLPRYFWLGVLLVGLLLAESVAFYLYAGHLGFAAEGPLVTSMVFALFGVGLLVLREQRRRLAIRYVWVQSETEALRRIGPLFADVRADLDDGLTALGRELTGLQAGPSTGSDLSTMKRALARIATVSHRLHRLEHLPHETSYDVGEAERRFCAGERTPGSSEEPGANAQRARRDRAVWNGVRVARCRPGAAPARLSVSVFSSTTTEVRPRCLKRVPTASALTTVSIASLFHKNIVDTLQQVSDDAVDSPRGGKSMARHAFFVAAVAAAGCTLDLQPAPDVLHARFDPSSRVIPMPNDMVRDQAKGVLALPISDDLSPAEKELRGWLNEQDGFPSTFAATLSFDAPVEPTTIDANSVQVWLWGETPVQLAPNDVVRTLDRDGTELSVQPPELGWERGSTYVVAVRGGAAGVRGAHRQRVLPDAAFTFLLSKQKLDDPRHQHAFPGATRDERMANAKALEEVRVRLQPYFDFLAARGLPREEIAALWTFTTTSRFELAMDAPSQRMPLPFDLLLDPHTGRIAIPLRASDTPVESEGKQRLADYDGWGLSANLMFESTGPLAATLPAGAVELWEVSDTPRQIPVTLRTFSDRMHVEVTPQQLPLREATTYGLVVRDTLGGADGRPVAPMIIGHFMRAHAPVAVSGKSQIASVPDEDAARVELARGRISTLLDKIGRDHVITAWPFTTQRVVPHIEEAIARAATVAPPAVPQNVKHLTPVEALLDFVLGIASLTNVKDVYYGSLQMPTWLDPKTRSWRADGGHSMRDVQFAMTIPRNAPSPMPVVIFGHAIVTERRFVLAIGDALAQRGFAAIAIDFPYHGEQTICTDNALLAVPDPKTGEIKHLPPCESGSTCVDGKCVDANGQGNHLARFPVLTFPVASGAAFIEIDHLANTRDHFMQAVVDLTTLERSLKGADWTAAGGIHFDPQNVYYAGQSLGGIIGATYVSNAPGLKRAVLNVPGADLVDMFRESSYFASHVTAFFTREKIDPESWQAARFLNLARLIVDAVDPQSVVQKLQGRPVMVQMATLDAIIPNSTTELLSSIANAPRRDYVAEHAFLVIPIEPAYASGVSDLSDFLAGKLKP